LRFTIVLPACFSAVPLRTEQPPAYSVDKGPEARIYCAFRATMAAYDLFLSYASADLAAAERLEAWLQRPPRSRRVWRDRRGILPGAPDFYPPIADGIAASAAFLLVLSPRWLRSAVAAQELADASAAGKKLVPVVHPAIPRDPSSPEGREQKSELMQALHTSAQRGVLERVNWIWLTTGERADPQFEAVELALATDFAWAARHTVLVERLRRWQAVQDGGALLRGAELADILADAFVDAPGRLPVLTEEQRGFLLESQRHESAERERVEGLYWGAEARAAAFAARERAEGEPDLALLLAAEGTSVASVPEAKSALLSLLHRYAPLTATLHEHGPGRQVAAVALSRDGRWLASVDRPIAIGDERIAQLLIWDAETGRREARVPSQAPLTAAAWGARWLAVASPDSIGWLRWDDWKEKFRANTPTALDGPVVPTFLAFSPAALVLPQGETLAWGTPFGDVGLIRVGDQVRWQGRLSEDRSSRALSGLGWLSDGNLITAEQGRLLVRSVPDLELVQEVAAPGEVFSLTTDGERWIAACRRAGRAGILLGRGIAVEAFLPAHAHAAELSLTADRAGGPADDPVLVVGSGVRRSGTSAVALWQGETFRRSLLAGVEVPVTSIAADPTGRFVAAGEMRGRVWLWDRERRSHLVRPLLPGVQARCIAPSPSGTIAVATQDHRVIHLGTDLDRKTVVPLPFAAARLLFLDSGRVLVAVSEEGRLHACRADGTTSDLSWPTGMAAAREIAAASDAPLMAASTAGDAVVVLRLAGDTWSQVCRIDTGAPVAALALDPGGQRIFAVVSNLTLDVLSWRVDAPDAAPVAVAQVSGVPPVPLACVDSRVLVVGDDDDLVLAPVEEPERAIRLGGHDNPIKRVSAGGDVVASVASWFQEPAVDQVRLWTAGGQELGSVTLAENTIDIALLCDGSGLVALGHSGGLWRVALKSDDLIAVARRVAGRRLSAEEERRYGVDVWRARQRGR
jgi:hypothetical protein